MRKIPYERRVRIKNACLAARRDADPDRRRRIRLGSHRARLVEADGAIEYDAAAVRFDRDAARYDLKLMREGEIVDFPGWWCDDWIDVARVAWWLANGEDPGLFYD